MVERRKEEKVMLTTEFSMMVNSLVTLIIKELNYKELKWIRQVYSDDMEFNILITPNHPHPFSTPSVLQFDLSYLI